MTSHTLEWKRQQLAELKELASKHPVIAVVAIDRFPAGMFQKIRKALQGKAVVKVSKNRIVKKAFEEQGIGKDFLEKVSGSIAVIFTEMNPFELYSFVKKNEGNAFASFGMVAPGDILVPAGDSGLPPGPALSDLKAAGLKTRLEGSTIKIAEDTVVTKEGEIVTKAVAGALQKLEIKPISFKLHSIINQYYIVFSNKIF